MQRLQALPRHVGVDLCGRDVGMAQEELDHPQVGAVIDEMRGERVAQRVRRDRATYAGRLTISLDEAPEGLARHGPAACGYEERVRLARAQELPARLALVACDPLHGLL